MKPETCNLQRRAFTLIELLVVISIVGLLLTAGLVSYRTVSQRSRDAKRKSDIEQIRSALEFFRSENGFYPAPAVNASVFGDAENLDTDAVATDLVPKYISTIPKDPRDDEVNPAYQYRFEATDLIGSNYYGYCLSATLESETPVSTTCVDTLSTQNYGVKNP